MSTNDKNSHNSKRSKKPREEALADGVKNEKIRERAKQAQEERARQRMLPIEEKSNKKGCKGFYHVELLPLVEKWASEGLNNKQIAQSLNIGLTTFYEWMSKIPDFTLSIMKYRQVADIQVENALFKNAIGFNYTEQQATPSGKVVKVQKFRLPETKAQSIWLYNRRSDRWKHKIETTLNLPQDISQMMFAIKRRDE